MLLCEVVEQSLGVQFPRGEIPYLVRHILDGVANYSCVGGLFQLSTWLSDQQISTNLLHIINIFSLNWFGFKSVASALVSTEGVATIMISNQRLEADFQNFLASGFVGEFFFARQDIFAVSSCPWM